MSFVVTPLSFVSNSGCISQSETHKIAKENSDRCDERNVIFRS